MKKHSLSLLSTSLFLCLLLCGCAKNVTLSSGSIKDDVQQVTAVVTADDLTLLDSMDALTAADFSGSTCYAEILEWAARHPEVEVRYTVSFPGGITAENTATDLDLTGLSDADVETAMENLAFLPQLKAVTLGTEDSGLSPAAANLFSDRFPALDFDYHCRLFGKESDLSETVLDLSAVPPDEILASLDTLTAMRNLQEMDLGRDEREDSPTWDQISAIREALPGVKLDYSFSFFDYSFTLEDEEMDISYRPVRDTWPEVLTAAKCMPNLKSLMMDSCGVSNEDMATMRDALPEAEVVWRVDFGSKYTARTDEIRILASYGGITNRDNETLKYFTKLKYLDVGHNEAITDLSFVRYMPDLEVLIIAMNPLGDLTPLADCENLEYLELFYSNTDDLSPLAGLKNLKHLNVGHCPHLTDISPIYDLELDRFYLGTYTFCPVPAEQVDHYRELHPDCEVDNSLWESSEGAWRRGANLQGEELEWYMQQPYYREDWKRFAPRYALLRVQMRYEGLHYSFPWNDPYYKQMKSNGYPYDYKP